MTWLLLRLSQRCRQCGLQAAELDGALRGALEGGSGGSSRRHPLVLVASLVDKVPNLAGLTRTCEVFG